MKETAKLIETKNMEAKEGNEAFLFLYQRGILLALKEQGLLNEQQCRYAEGKLKKQGGKRGKRL